MKPTALPSVSLFFFFCTCVSLARADSWDLCELWPVGGLKSHVGTSCCVARLHLEPCFLGPPSIQRYTCVLVPPILGRHRALKPVTTPYCTTTPYLDTYSCNICSTSARSSCLLSCQKWTPLKKRWSGLVRTKTGATVFNGTQMPTRRILARESMQPQYKYNAECEDATNVHYQATPKVL